MTADDSQLCRTIQSSPSRKARQKAWLSLLDKHKGLIAKLAQKYLCEGVNVKDMYQEAVIGFRYSALSYDPEKAKFTTHAGWGVMKYCLKLKQSIQKHAGENNISQSPVAHEAYHRALTTTKLPIKLSTKSFSKIHKQAQLLGLPREDIIVLALAYHVGTREQRRKWRQELWCQWLQERISSTCKRMESKLKPARKDDRLFNG